MASARLLTVSAPADLDTLNANLQLNNGIVRRRSFALQPFARPLN